MTKLPSDTLEIVYLEYETRTGVRAGITPYPARRGIPDYWVEMILNDTHVLGPDFALVRWADKLASHAWLPVPKASTIVSITLRYFGKGKEGETIILQ